VTINLKYALNTERAKVRRVAEHWRAQYPVGKQDRYSFDPDAVCAKLQALDVDTATAEDVEHIVGNKSWCGPCECNQCGKTTYHTITLGEPRNYESATATLCLWCLREAVKALETVAP
jgi:hypothetical protein